MEISHFWLQETEVSVYSYKWGCFVKQEKRKNLEIARTSLCCWSTTDKMNSLPPEICHCLPKKTTWYSFWGGRICHIWLCSQSQCSDLLTQMKQHLYLWFYEKQSSPTVTEARSIALIEQWGGNVLCPPVQHYKSWRYVVNLSYKRLYWNVLAMNLPLLSFYFLKTWAEINKPSSRLSIKTQK